MFKETVEVISAWEDRVKVKFTKKEMCSCCKLSAVCGMGEEALVLDNNRLTLKAGDNIEIGIEEKKTILASLIIFLMPALLFVSSLVFFKDYGEALSFSLAILMLCIYYVGVKRALRKKGKEFTLKILRKIQTNEKHCRIGFRKRNEFPSSG